MPDRDGSRDFDFLFGSWDIRLKRLLRPLTGSTSWVEFSGTSRCRPLWGGRANVDELTAVNLTDRTQIEGLTLRLYNPEAAEWSIYWANSRTGAIGTPQKGHFVNGRGEFFDRDVFDGKPVIVRYVWTGGSTPVPHFEQAFSADDGKTWETNWITDQTRRTDKAGGET